MDKIIKVSMTDKQWKVYHIANIVAVISITVFFITIGAMLMDTLISWAIKERMLLSVKEMLFIAIIAVVIYAIAKTVRDLLEKYGEKKGQGEQNNA